MARTMISRQPIVADAVAQPAAAPLSEGSREAPTRRPAPVLRVLIVEDQALIALALAADLAACGCELIGRAASGEQALELASRLAPDLVLMDMHLSGVIDGVEAAARIQRDGGPWIVFVTAFADGENRARMEAVGPAAILAKPYDPEELARAVRVCAARRAAQHALAAAGEAD